MLVFVGSVGGGLEFVRREALDHVDQLLLFVSGGKRDHRKSTFSNYPSASGGPISSMP